MKKNTLSFLILISGILISGGIINFTNAQTDSRTVPEISYPVVELGSCADKESCKVYCDKTNNIDACLSFAEKNNLMSSEELANAKKFKDTGMTGPGGCKGKDKCDTYCSDPANIDECITFAEKNGLMSGEKLDEAKKVQAAIAKGIKPPACGGKEACDTYCSSSEHMEECMNFSIEAGIMDPQKQEESKKVLAAIKQGIKPPACKGKDACDEYCGDSAHQQECMTFALAAGMVSDDQKEQMQKTLDAFKQGIKPPACKPNPPSESGQSGQPGQTQPVQANKSSQFGQGLQACDQYCADPNHVEECVKFSVAIGNMTEEQAQSSIKNGGKGPGGCVGRDACNTFCDNPDNQDTCFNFAKDNGMISQEDLQNMQNGQPGENQQGQNQQGQNQLQNELKCSPKGTVASFVCAKNGRNANTGGPETTYFNSCTALQAGAEIIHEGVCEGHNPCGSVADPVCGNDGNTWVSACYANEQGGGVKYEGVCKNPSGQQNKQQNKQQNTQQNQQRQNQQNQSGDKFQPRSGTTNPGGQQMPQQAGPGGCKGPEECQKYCASNPEVCKNFQPQQNQQNQPGQMQPQQQNPPPPPSPSGFLQGTQKLFANPLNAF
jgi:hypothetical protein